MASYEFATTLATITARAAVRWRFLDADDAVSFAWYSVNAVGDAEEVDDDLQRHFEMWLAERMMP
jgi:hypothetical protein